VVHLEQVLAINQPMSNSEAKIKYQETLSDTTQTLMLMMNTFPIFNNKFISWNSSSKFLRKKLLKMRKNPESVVCSMMKSQVINISTCLRPSTCKWEEISTRSNRIWTSINLTSLVSNSFSTLRSIQSRTIPQSYMMNRQIMTLK